jgi:hypothetical protein
MLNLFGGAMAISAGSSVSTQGLPCHNLDPGAGGTIDLLAPSGHSIFLQSAREGDAWLYLSYLGDPTAQIWHGQLAAATPVRVYLPDTGKPVNWRVRVKVSNPTSMQVCGAADVQVGPAGG